VDPFFLICNLIMGAAAGAAVFAGRSNYESLVERVEADLRERLRALRVPTQFLRRRIHLWIAVTGIVFFSVWIGLDSFVFAVLAASLMCAGPWLLVRRIAMQRKIKIEDQMADAMMSFSSAVRAGLSLAQSLELVADESPDPIRQEFQQIVGEYKLGKPLERTLNEAKARLKSENFILFAAAMLASRESGGRLNETVERISRSVQELQRLERKVRSETAQARKSAVYMAIAPAFILVVYSFIDPENTSKLFTTLPGQLMLSVAIVLNLAAYLWAVKILNADI